MRDKSILHIIFSELFGFVIFIILLTAAFILGDYIKNPAYSVTVNFFMENLGLAITILIMSIISKIFWKLHFPFNIPAPIFSAVFGIYVTTYVYKLWELMESMMTVGIVIPINLIYAVVFWIVIITGYVSIFTKKKKREIEKRIEVKLKKKNWVEWKDVENEFRLFLYNIGKAMNDSFERTEEKRKTRRTRRSKRKK